jgi:hypothetical protein
VATEAIVADLITIAPNLIKILTLSTIVMLVIIIIRRREEATGSNL